MTVISSKTENHGQGQRTVPMFARLRPFLEDTWDYPVKGKPTSFFQRACTPSTETVLFPVHQSQETARKGRNQETRNPGFAGVCEPMPYCTYRQVEAAGIEPASRDVSARASTRVVG